jgi:hypothetical protein
MNRLAHADIKSLRWLAAREPKPQRPFDSSVPWARATSFMASELLAAADNDPETLRKLQFRVLIPIELGLLADRSLVSSPQELVRRLYRGLSSRDSFGRPVKSIEE